MGSSDDPGTCNLCEVVPATALWDRLPVCKPCAELLTELRDDLEDMEAEDPAFAELAEEVEEAYQKLIADDGDSS